ncbi:MAG: septal ring lytic transglycosylase RlpA family protein [Methylobacter sp.]|nr:septal ring lytic transglycosylase RlpA family protein [Methylobacter sp.]
MNYSLVFNFYGSNNYSGSGLLGLLALLTALLSGCASEPPLLSSGTSSDTDQYTYRRSAPYNKPYKVKGKTYYPMTSAAGYSERGIASWYGSESGNKTAMGTRFRPQGVSAAHKTLPLPCKVRVTNLHNGRSIDLVVNDRGPFKKNRLIDLSHGAAKKLGLKGMAEVKVEYLSNKVSSVD